MASFLFTMIPKHSYTNYKSYSCAFTIHIKSTQYSNKLPTGNSFKVSKNLQHWEWLLCFNLPDDIHFLWVWSRGNFDPAYKDIVSTTRQRILEEWTTYTLYDHIIYAVSTFLYSSLFQSWKYISQSWRNISFWILGGINLGDGHLLV